MTRRMRPWVVAATLVTASLAGICRADEPPPARTVILDTTGFWRLHHTLRPPVIQLPDGLKPRAAKIQKAIESQTDAEVLIWVGSCFGACDTPNLPQSMQVDLLIQWGHARWT